jgi:hypothetical protein
MRDGMSVSAIGWLIRGGTSLRVCGCGSWIRHWITYSGQSWPPRCSVASCSNAPSVGGHVVHQGGMGEGIAPLCAACNGVGGVVMLRSGISIASANKADTCEGVSRAELRAV